MPDIIKSFLILLFSIAFVIIIIGEIASRKGEIDIDSQYYTSDGDHIYYERSLIEKKEFHKRFPHISIRKISGLFFAKKK